MALRYARVPVVVAPAGLTLGGGCEIALHGDRVQAAAETYMGLVEVGVGLDSGRRRHQGDAGARRGAAAGRRPTCCRPCSGRSRRSRSRKVSTSGRDARRLGYLRADRRHHDEPRAADRRREGQRARARRARATSTPRRATAIRVGGEPCCAPLEARRAPGLARRPHQRSRRADRPQARRASSRGGVAAARDDASSEQYLLDLEREAFLSLCGERKTLERIQHTLKTGKPLRN